MPQDAQANNEKVFPKFAQKLSSDNQDAFCTYAARLSKWLSSDKAYYQSARPQVRSPFLTRIPRADDAQIINLLEVCPTHIALPTPHSNERLPDRTSDRPSTKRQRGPTSRH